MRRWHRAGGALLLLACILCGALLWQNWPRETAESMVQESLKKREAQPSRPMPALPEAEAFLAEFFPAYGYTLDDQTN